MIEHKIEGLDGCNAYMRTTVISDEPRKPIVSIELISYSVCVACAVIWASGTVTVHLDRTSTCSATTVRHVKRFLSLTECRYEAQMPKLAYNALHVGQLDTLLSAFNDAAYGQRCYVCERVKTLKCGCYDRGYLEERLECFKRSYEPRRAYDNGYAHVEPAYVGSWRTW